MRLDLSALNSQKFHFGFIYDASCPKCGFASEDVSHFFFLCVKYVARREVLFACIDRIIDQTQYFRNRTNLSRLKMLKWQPFLLYGDNDWSFETNIELLNVFFLQVHTKSKRVVYKQYRQRRYM